MTQLLPPEVIEQDHALERAHDETLMSLAELRWRWTLGPDGLLFNDDGTPMLVVDRVRTQQEYGEHQRRTFKEYAVAVDRTLDAISRMARGYEEWLRQHDAGDDSLSITDCCALATVVSEKRAELIDYARTQGVSISTAKNYRYAASRKQRGVTPSEPAVQRVRRLLEQADTPTTPEAQLAEENELDIIEQLIPLRRMKLRPKTSI